MIIMLFLNAIFIFVWAFLSIDEFHKYTIGRQKMRLFQSFLSLLLMAIMILAIGKH